MLTVPVYHEMFNPLIESFRNLQGSGRNDELLKEVVKTMSLSDEVASIPHGTGGLSEVGYRLAWARTYLKKYGLIDNSVRGVWALTPKGTMTQTVDPAEVVNCVRSLGVNSSTPSSGTNVLNTAAESGDVEVDDETLWKGEAMSVLLSLEPSSFERLVIRVLRESGFDDVTVTGKSGDGGIDGKGIVRINGILSFHAIVQCMYLSTEKYAT